MTPWQTRTESGLKPHRLNSCHVASSFLSSVISKMACSGLGHSHIFQPESEHPMLRSFTVLLVYLATVCIAALPAIVALTRGRGVFRSVTVVFSALAFLPSLRAIAKFW